MKIDIPVGFDSWLVDDYIKSVGCFKKMIAEGQIPTDLFPVYIDRHKYLRKDLEVDNKPPKRKAGLETHWKVSPSSLDSMA